jgi:hypothetical protein
MKLEKPIRITPPKMTDQKGNVITPQPFMMNVLQVTYIDTPHLRIISASISPFPIPLKLWSENEYDLIGDWTQKQAETRVLELLGTNIEVSLRNLYPPTLEDDPNGPGSILSKMFYKIGIKSTPNCACKRHALNMNKNGIEWCEQNVDTIVGWLKIEAQNRKLPFIDMVAKMIVLRAINKSKKLKEKESRSIDKT